MISQKFGWKLFCGSPHWTLKTEHLLNTGWCAHMSIKIRTKFEPNSNEQSSASCDGMPMLMRGKIGTMTIALFIDKLMETYNNASTIGKLVTRCIPPLVDHQSHSSNSIFRIFKTCGVWCLVGQISLLKLIPIHFVLRVFYSLLFFIHSCDSNMASRFFGNILNEGDISNLWEWIRMGADILLLWNMYNGPEKRVLWNIISFWCMLNVVRCKKLLNEYRILCSFSLVADRISYRCD